MYNSVEMKPILSENRGTKITKEGTMSRPNITIRPQKLLIPARSIKVNKRAKGELPSLQIARSHDRARHLQLLRHELASGHMILKLKCRGNNAVVISAMPTSSRRLHARRGKMKGETKYFRRS